ncbi:MAG TPA: phosphatase PAP2 family protein [Gemmatimonadota bacterium]|nr:phosphatase PAP2 family protein [Gemmatimonadota bacterium]
MSSDPRKPRRSMADAVAQRLEGHRDIASAWATALGELGAVDRATYAAVAETPTPSLDEPLRRLSNAANNSRLWLGIAAALAALGGRRGRRAALEGAVAIGVTSGTVNLLAKSIARPRPDREELNPFPSRAVPMPMSSSFPSRHAASAFAFSYAVGRQIPELAVPIRLLAGAVAYSRVHLGVHHPGDVTVGAMIGSGIAAMLSSVGDQLVGGLFARRPARPRCVSPLPRPENRLIRLWSRSQPPRSHHHSQPTSHDR